MRIENGEQRPMHIHAERIAWMRTAPGLDELSIWTLRLYDDADGFERYMPYHAVATVTMLGVRAWVSGLHGRVNRASWYLFNDWLKAQGVTSVAVERHGRRIERPVT